MLLKMVGNDGSYICFVVKEQKREIMSVVLSEKLCFFFLNQQSSGSVCLMLKNKHRGKDQTGIMKH